MAGKGAMLGLAPPEPRSAVGGMLPAGMKPSGVMKSYTPTLSERTADVIRKFLFSDNREGQQKANRVMDVLSVTPVGMATDLYDAGREAGMGNYGTAGLMLGMAGMPGPSPKKGIRAFHGSPHSFDKFDMSKIGTGEGAQAYGHGLYFAENEGVARGYRDNLTADRTGPAKRLLAKYGGDVDAALDAARTEIARLQNLNLTPETGLDRARSMIETQENNIAMLNALKNSGEMSGGRMYEVRINADPEAFLDWDKPLSEQPVVRDRLIRSVASRAGGPAIVNDYMFGAVRTQDGFQPRVDGPDGQRIYRDVTFRTRDEAIAAGRERLLETFTKPKSQRESEILREAGIPGIKYLDAGSRGAGDGTRNYVVFDDKLVEIVRKYGIAGASAMLGYNLLDGMDPAQAEELKRIEGQR